MSTPVPSRATTARNHTPDRRSERPISLSAPTPVALTDRIAMRLGLALILWSSRQARRPLDAGETDRLRRLARDDVDRERSEREQWMLHQQHFHGLR